MANDMNYYERLNEVVETALSMPGTGGGRAFRRIIEDLNRDDSAISELLFTLDEGNFRMIINLLLEFKRTGNRMNFNTLHRDALRALGDNQ